MKNDELPLIKVGKVIEHDDGACTVEFETNDAFDKMYLEKTGKKRVTEKGLGKYINDLLLKAIKNEDGYGIK